MNAKEGILQTCLLGKILAAPDRNAGAFDYVARAPGKLNQRQVFSLLLCCPSQFVQNSVMYASGLAEVIYQVCPVFSDQEDSERPLLPGLPPISQPSAIQVP